MTIWNIIIGMLFNILKTIKMTRTLITLVFLMMHILIACNGGNETSKIQENGILKSEVDLKSTLQNYLDALINPDKEIISLYFYKDAVKHFSKYANFEFKLNEFIEENLVQSALDAKNLYVEQGVNHFYSIDKEIDMLIIKNYTINSFLVIDNLVLGEKSIRDTSRVLAFQKGSNIEFLAVTKEVENILSYKFNKDEIEKILNSTFEGNYAKILKRAML
jgi:hypothetical protein